jgi:hypothetical protein
VGSKERTAPKPRKKRDIPTVILSKFPKRSIHSIWQEIIDSPSEKFYFHAMANTLDEDN